MADKRIIELEERLTLSDGDYFATDNTNGTCKVNAKILLDRFSDDEDAIATKAAKVDLTNISITGSTNNTGSTIASGTYFYKDGTLVKAIAAIANGATLTLNTNYAIVTAGGLNDLNNALHYKFIRGAVANGHISIPSGASELLIAVNDGRVDRTDVIADLFTITISTDWLTTIPKQFALTEGIAIRVSKTEVWLQDCVYAGTNYLSTAYTSLYCR